MKRAAAICLVLLLATGWLSTQAVLNSNTATRQAAATARIAALSAAQVKAGLFSQTANRTKNVYVRCHAINQEQRVLVAYVDAARRIDSRVARLNLQPLPCQTLATATTKSARAK